MPILLGLQVPPYEQKDDTNRINLKIRFIVEPRLDERLQLLVMINSMPDRFEERRRIRESWAMSELYDETTKVLFLIGKPNTVQIEEKLVVEEAGFHDVVVADIEEGYYSLSLKTYAMLYFKNTRIPAAKCLVKADSDNVLLIRNYERLCDETIGPRIVGKCDVSTRVQRGRTKWMVPESIFPNKSFPKYCSSGTYVLCGPDVPQRLLKASEDSWFPYSSNYRKLPEDVLFTGILAERAGIRRSHVGGMSFIDAPEYFCREGKHTYSIHMNRVRDPRRYLQRLLSMEGHPCSF